MEGKQNLLIIWDTLAESQLKEIYQTILMESYQGA